MFKEIFEYVTHNKCSDLHLSCKNYPMVRISGKLQPIENMPRIDPVHLDKFIETILSPEQYKNFQENEEIDFALNIEGGHRFRTNIFKNLNGPAIALRPISKQSKTLSQINAPGVIKELLERRQGLVLVSGPTGCGKSTTLSAMIDYINENHASNIITIEDPIEHIHQSKKSLISHREIGTHSNSFSNALRAALREDPDIILVGEMRDLETISLALTAAETGHLVLGTLHTSSAANAVSRIIDVFHPAEQQVVRTMLANSLNAVILQHLMPTVDNNVEAAFEILISNSSIRNMIREDKLAQINSMMEMGRKQGMITFRDSVELLLHQKKITKETAVEFIRKF